MWVQYHSKKDIPVDSNSIQVKPKSLCENLKAKGEQDLKLEKLMPTKDV